jgi:N-acetylneuraminate synthase
MNNSISVNGRELSQTASPYLIAEVSGNHKGSKDRMLKLMLEAHQQGFDAVKIQVFNAEDMTLDIDSQDFVIQSGMWQGRTLYDVYEEASTPEEWFDDLFELAERQNITLFPSIFSKRGLNLMETKYNCPLYKIASFEAMDLPLIEMVANTGKPLIVSTGIIDEHGIEDLLTELGEFKDLVLLHCISNYPAPAESFNLRTMQDISSRFGCLTGLSDHSMDETAAVVSSALGAVAIEKHITISRDDGAIDSPFSLPIAEFQNFVRKVKEAHSSLGSVNYKSSSPRKNFRSLYVCESMKAGDIFNESNLRSIRPGHGLAPKFYKEILGKKASQDIALGTPLDWQLVAK